MTEKEKKHIDLLHHLLKADAFESTIRDEYGDRADEILKEYSTNTDAVDEPEESGKYSALTRFIPVAGKEDKAEILGAGAVRYSKTIREFAQAVSDFEVNHEDMDLWDFKTILKNKGIAWSAKALEDADVSNADVKTVLALITAVVDTEKIDEGTIDRFWNNKCIEKWLKRLQELDEK